MRKGLQTSELKFVIGFLLIGIGIQHFISPIISWAVAVMLVTSGYCLARAFFKMNRGVELQYSGYRTSEFFVVLAGVLVILESVYFSKLELGVAYFLVSIQVLSYCISRGLTKGKQRTQAQVHLLR